MYLYSPRSETQFSVFSQNLKNLTFLRFVRQLEMFCAVHGQLFYSLPTYGAEWKIPDRVLTHSTHCATHINVYPILTVYLHTVLNGRLSRTP